MEPCRDYLDKNLTNEVCKVFLVIDHGAGNWEIILGVWVRYIASGVVSKDALVVDWVVIHEG